MTTRIGLGLIGILVAAYGGWLLLDLGLDNLVATGTWLVGGVLLHDAVLAPLVIVVCAVPVGRWRGPLAAGLLVLGAITVSAIPVLTGAGRRADNPTLLDRHYWIGWLVLAAVVLVGVVATGLVRRKS